MILRLPQKLNDQLKGGPLGKLQTHANPLLDWSVRSFAGEASEYLLVCNTQSLYCVVLSDFSVADAAQFTEQVLGVVQAVLEGVGCGVIGRGVESVQFAKFLNRSVTGSLNELVTHATALLADGDISETPSGAGLHPMRIHVAAPLAPVSEMFSPCEQFLRVHHYMTVGGQMTADTPITITELARQLGIRTYQLRYAHQQWHLPEPPWIAGKRVYGHAEGVRFIYRGRDYSAEVLRLERWGWRCRPDRDPGSDAPAWMSCSWAGIGASE